MRRLVHVLSLTTVTFAASTAFFARELYRERARSEAAAVPAASTETAAGKIANAKPAPQAYRRSRRDTDSSAAAEPVDVVSQASPDPVRELAKLSDPAQRTKMIQERKSTFRMVHPDLAEYLHLDDDEFERFIDLMARHELDLLESSLRCYLDESCRKHGVDPDLREAQKREVADLFGAQTQEAFDFYRYTSGERQTTKELRARLPDKLRLSDSQSQALVGALYEEQQRINGDIQQREVKVSSFNNMVYIPLPGAPPERDAVQAAAEYNRMLRDRAGSVLTSEQLAVYERMQKEALQIYESSDYLTGRQKAQSPSD